MNQELTFMKNMQIPVYFFNNEFKIKKYSMFPYFTYKDGTPCMPLNLYMQSEGLLKLSEQTIKKIAHALTHILRFCESNNVRFSIFTENDLLAFGNYLQESKRENSTILFILTNTLNFFNYIGKKLFNIENYSIDVLRCFYRKTTHKSKENNSLYHTCFPAKNPQKTRSPVSLSNIEKMYENITKTSDSVFVQKRNRVILKLLENTGARVSEIALLKVEDILNIFNQNQGSPTLKIRTLKRRGDLVDYRFIPVNKADFNEVLSYINIYRSKVIKHTVGKVNDEGFLLIGETTGKVILSNTITNEINKICKVSNIEEKVCAHMFRHRFITNLFIQLIKQYDKENKDKFRNSLMDLENLKVYIQQVTGHQNIKSLENYIDIAKSELTNMNIVIDNVANIQNENGIIKEKRRLLELLKKGEITTNEYIKQMETL